MQRKIHFPRAFNDMNHFPCHILDSIEKQVGTPGILYHYCNAGALLGIIKDDTTPDTGTFWATAIEYMNDFNEYFSLRSLAKEAGTDQRFGKLHPGVQQFLTDFSELPASSDPNQVFVICFSANGNKLSQWRNYTEAYQGYSLGITTKKIKELAGSSVNDPNVTGAFFGPCIYDRQDQLDALFACAEQFNADIENLRLGLHLLAPFVKNAAFREEEEWRLVIHNPNPRSYKFRPGKSTIVPYIAAQVNGFRASLKKIWLGPTPNPEIACYALRDFLIKNEMADTTEYEYCNIPYRSLI
jgi:hypothetical protein